VGGLKSQCEVRELAPLVCMNVIFSQYLILEEHTPSDCQISLLLCVWRSFESKCHAISKVWTKENFVCGTKNYFLKGKSPQETKEKLDKHYGESAPSIRMVYKWFQHFQSGQMSINDAERSGCLVEATTPEIFDKTHAMVMDDTRVKVQKIASAVGISNERVHNILHQHLNMRKLSARWVPRLLTVDQKQNHVRCSKENLQLFQQNLQHFRRHFFTVDEPWIHHHTPETQGTV
jgi:histone-lysine N-methyltransferase SETMAR